MVFAFPFQPLEAPVVVLFISSVVSSYISVDSFICPHMFGSKNAITLCISHSLNVKPSGIRVSRLYGATREIPHQAANSSASKFLHPSL